MPSIAAIRNTFVLISSSADSSPAARASGSNEAVALIQCEQATVDFVAQRRQSATQLGTGKDRKAIDSVNLTVHRGQRLGLIGQSGCGKTTLLRVLSGLQAITSGEVTAPADLSMGFVFQQPALLPWRKVLANVTLPLQLGRRKKIEDKSLMIKQARECLAEVELAGSEDQYPHELSGGMKMRVSMARALVNQPELLLLDEPFAALDDLLREQLGELLTKLWRLHSFTMVMVTHNIADAIRLSDRICLLHDGKVIADLPNPMTSVDVESPQRRQLFSAFHEELSDRLRSAAGIDS